MQSCEQIFKKLVSLIVNVEDYILFCHVQEMHLLIVAVGQEVNWATAFGRKEHFYKQWSSNDYWLSSHFNKHYDL